MAGLVHVFHHLDDNLGDKMSAPRRYFPWLAAGTVIDPWDHQVGPFTPGDVAITGGGGLIRDVPGDPFHENLRVIASAAPFSVGWGIGHNHHFDRVNGSSRAYPSYLAGFDLLGVRDWDAGFTWVPCVSCLDPGFTQVRPAPAHELVLYAHWDDHSDPEITGIPTMRNSEKSFGRVLDFLSSGETVLTNSYHGAYWATLLGRKVVVVEPFSSKFHTFRHPPAVASKHNWRSALAAARTYPGALDECRFANEQFAIRVRQLCDRAGVCG